MTFIVYTSTVLADANFPSASICKSGPELVRADGHAIPPLLKAITTLFPLDTYVSAPVRSTVMSCIMIVISLCVRDSERLAVPWYRSIKFVPLWISFSDRGWGETLSTHHNTLIVLCVHSGESYILLFCFRYF